MGLFFPKTMVQLTVEELTELAGKGSAYMVCLRERCIEYRGKVGILVIKEQNDEEGNFKITYNWVKFGRCEIVEDYDMIHPIEEEEFFFFKTQKEALSFIGKQLEKQKENARIIKKLL